MERCFRQPIGNDGAAETAQETKAIHTNDKANPGPEEEKTLACAPDAVKRTTFILLITLVSSTAVYGQVRIPKLPPSATPTAAAVAKARLSYGRAAQFYEAGKNKLALEAARQTFELLPNASSALILATIYTELGQPCAAFDVGLVALDMDPTPAEYKMLSESLVSHGKECGTGFGWIQLDIDPEDTVVRLEKTVLPNGRRVGVAAGLYPIDLTAPEHDSHTSNVSISAGTGFLLRTKLVKTEKVVQAAPKSTIVAMPLPPQGRPNFAPYQWTLLGVGILGISAQILMLSKAYTAEEKASELAEPSTQASDDRQRAYERERENATTWARAGWVVGGIGATALGAAIVWWSLDESVESQGWLMPTGDGRGAALGWSGAF